jgi:hypothetical protein
MENRLTNVDGAKKAENRAMLTLGFWRSLKCYLEIPFISRIERRKKITYIPLSLGLHISWSDYYFKRCDSEEFFPRGEKEGNHILTIYGGIAYWGIRFILYLPINRS